MRNKPAKDFVLRVVISFLVACLLWVFAITDTDPTITQTFSSVPITFQNADVLSSNGLTYTAAINSVDIQLYGRTIQLSKIKSSDIYAIVDFSNLRQEGNYSLEVSVKGVADNISVVNISPQYVNITVSKIVEDSSSFAIDFSGTLSDGYVITDYESDTNLVSLSGSVEALESVAVVQGTVDIQDKQEDFSALVTLKAYDSDDNQLYNVDITPKEVQVYVAIGTTKEVTVTPIVAGNLPPGYQVAEINVQPTTITIAGKASILNNISTINTAAIDITGQTTTFTVEADFDLPDGAIIYSEDAVRITVTIEKLETKTLTSDKLQVRNSPAGMEIDLSAFSGLTMILEGKSDLIDSVTVDDISIYIDLSDISETGTFVVPIQYTIPADLTMKSIDVAEVSVTLSN